MNAAARIGAGTSKNSAHSAEDAGIGEVAGDQDHVERPGAWISSSRAEGLPSRSIAARARAPALDAKAVTLAHGMDVGQMGDAPCPGAS